MEKGETTRIREAQDFVKKFAEDNGWEDFPNVDKFDHLHEELIEMSKHLRYKTREEKEKFIEANQELFKDGIGDLFFGLCRLANQLGIAVDESFNFVKERIVEKYKGRQESKARE